MKTTNVKQSKKNSGWLLALPHEDEKGFEALAYLRKKGYFNTRLYRLNKNKSQKQITRYYLRYPQAEAYETWLKNGNGSIEAQAKRDIWKLERLNARLERQVADLTNKDYEEEIFIRETMTYLYFNEINWLHKTRRSEKEGRIGHTTGCWNNLSTCVAQ